MSIGIWRCKKCGHVNYICEANVLKGHCGHNWQVHWYYEKDVPENALFVWKEARL